MRRLPIYEGPLPSHEQREIKQGALEKIARAFMTQRYPLSKHGIQLKERVEHVLAGGDSQALDDLASELPTVEHPHPELFEDADWHDMPKGFIFDIANIQVTKGCSHKCTFCAAQAEHKVQVMPFAAIVRLNEGYRLHEQGIKQAWKRMEKDVIAIYPSIHAKCLEFEDVLREVMNDALSSIASSSDRALTEDQFADLLNDIRERTYKFGSSFVIFDKIRDRFKKHSAMLRSNVKREMFYRIRDVLEQNCRDIDEWYAGCSWSSVIRKDDIFYANMRLEYRRMLTNYYDSDPFDYVDARFRHQDGTPADYGDVVRLIATDARPIHITTAGWRKENKVAQRAAEKTVEHFRKNPGHDGGIRVSISPYDASAQRDLDAYWEDMKNVIQTLSGAPNKVQLLVFTPSRDSALRKEFYVKVTTKLGAFLESSKLRDRVTVSNASVSDYSVPTDYPGGEESNHDVMACMPGYHVHPDGKVLWQDYVTEHDPANLQAQTPTGSRPRYTGKYLFRVEV